MLTSAISGTAATGFPRKTKTSPCAGEAFPDGAKIWWKVQTWDENGEASEFSEPSVIVVEQQNQAVNPQRRPTHKLGGGDLEFIEGRCGQALRFGLDKPRVEAPSYSALQTRKGTTISAWIRPDKITNHWQCIYRKEDNESRRLLTIGQEGHVLGTLVQAKHWRVQGGVRRRDRQG